MKSVSLIEGQTRIMYYQLCQIQFYTICKIDKKNRADTGEITGSFEIQEGIRRSSPKSRKG